MAHQLTAPPALSTPDSHILTEIEPVSVVHPLQRLSDEQITIRYEISRTVREIKQNRGRRIALQFPDHMLPDSARVYQLLARGLQDTDPHDTTTTRTKVDDVTTRLEQDIASLNVDEPPKPVKLTILGDTSYGSCCVDEIAAEHIDADVVVHYGRSCLSPTARLPVIHIFTARELDLIATCKAFEAVFLVKNAKVIITADIPYAEHVEALVALLTKSGYTDIFGASIIHDPSSSIPNRTLPLSVVQDSSHLNEWELFHVSDPPTSLLLTLSSRMKGVHIYPTTPGGPPDLSSHQANTSIVLRRRYALITSLSTVSTWGILINTLSVQNYLRIVEYVRKQIANAGKKSYLFVVGKLNAAKVANFAEIGGWVVIGCWESSLIDSKDFYKPIITPFELDMVLAGDDNRIWTGEWRGNFQDVLDRAKEVEDRAEYKSELKMPGAFVGDDEHDDETIHDFDSEEESAPPEYDLRTGRYISHTRPVRAHMASERSRNGSEIDASSVAVVKKSKGELLAVNGVASPAAEFLAQKRTWRGLGSDFEITYEDDEENDDGGLVEEGRTGIASGYTVADSHRS